LYKLAFDRIIKPKKTDQIKEFYQNINQDHSFFNEDYKNLLLKLKENDELYSKSEETDDRIQLSKSTFSLWKNFFNKEIKGIDVEESNFSQTSYNLLKECFERQKVFLY